MADDVVGKLIFQVDTDVDGAKKGLEDFQDELKDTQNEAKNTDKEVSKASEGISIKAVAIATAVGTAVIKMSKEIAKATSTIQSGQKTIANATGATGKALEGLMQSAQTVFASSDESFDDVSTALGEINTRLGLTGKALEDATSQFLDFADATGQDVQQSVVSVTQAMNRWGIETDKMPSLLDKLTYAGQESGVSVANLTANLTANAGTLQAMGYSLDEAISMLMQFETQGIDANSVIMGMKKSFEDSAKAGTNARTDWENLLKSISDATDETEANRIAVETFGSRIATDMVSSLRSGALEFDKFTEAVKNSGGTLSSTDESAKTTADRITEFKNRVTVALSNIGTALAPLVDTMLPKLADGIETALGWVTNIVTAFTGNKTAVDELYTSVTDLTTATDTYRTATTNLTTDVDSMTEAEKRLYKIQQDRAKLAVDQSMKDVAEAYARAKEEIAENASEVERLQGKLDALDIAYKAQEEDLSILYDARLELMAKQREGIGLTEREKSTFDTLTDLIITRSWQGINYAKNLDDSYQQTYSNLLDATANYNDASLDLESTLNTLATAFSDGLLDLDKYRVLYPELVSEIEKYVSSMEETAEAVEDSGEKDKEKTSNVLNLNSVLGENIDVLKELFNKTNDGTDATNENNDAQKEAERLANEREKTTNSLNARLQEQDILIRKQTADEEELAGHIEGAYAIRARLLDEEMARELSALEKKVRANEATEADITKLKQIYANKQAQLNKQKDDAIRKQDEALKKEQERLEKEQTAKLKAEEEERIKAVQQAEAQRKALHDSTNAEIVDATNALSMNLGSAITGLIHEMTNGFSTAEDKVKSLKSATLAFAGLAGDAMYQLGKSLAEGEDGWKSLGKVALKALASIVRALAEEMAARAVIAAFSFNWAGAAALTAGSVAAFVGAGLIDGYADSLLIGKDYIPYDDFPARLHRGEMVLDRIDAEKFRRYGGMYGVEQMASAPLAMDTQRLSPLNINNQLSAVIEVDGTQLGIAVLKNIDNASQFVLR